MNEDLGNPLVLGAPVKDFAEVTVPLGSWEHVPAVRGRSGLAFEPDDILRWKVKRTSPPPRISGPPVACMAGWSPAMTHNEGCMVVALQPRRFRGAPVPPLRFRRVAPPLAGLGDASSLAASLAAAIQQVEGWYPPGSVVGGVSYPQGSLAYRNNNPGNIRPGSLAVGATGSSGGYAVFPDYQTGYSALVNLIQSPSYWNLTLTQFFQKYAPAADNNNPAAYASSVAASLGVDPNTPLSILASGGSGASSDAPGTGDSNDCILDGTCPDYTTIYGSGGAAGAPFPAAPDASSASVASDLSDILGGVSPVALAALGAVLLAAIIL